MIRDHQLGDTWRRAEQQSRNMIQTTILSSTLLMVRTYLFTSGDMAKQRRMADVIGTRME
jgi:hypothetical protein